MTARQTAPFWGDDVRLLPGGFEARAVRNANVLISPCILFVGPVLPYGRGARKLRALWDTGSEDCAISSTTAQRLGLVPVGGKPVLGMHGVQMALTYRARLVLPGGAEFDDCLLVECAPYDAAELIIGLNVIAAGDFTVSRRAGRVMFSYRKAGPDR